MTRAETIDDGAVARARPGPVASALAGLVRFYQRWISPVLPPSCRFEPSCSAYALEALIEHGALRGSWLAARRLLRCGPWHRGGYDPVPPRRDHRGRVRHALGDTDVPSPSRPASPTPAKE